MPRWFFLPPSCSSSHHPSAVWYQGGGGTNNINDGFDGTTYCKYDLLGKKGVDCCENGGRFGDDCPPKNGKNLRKLGSSFTPAPVAKTSSAVRAFEDELGVQAPLSGDVTQEHFDLPGDIDYSGAPPEILN